MGPAIVSLQDSSSSTDNSVSCDEGELPEDDSSQELVYTQTVEKF
jgi:hypothetical protein